MQPDSMMVVPAVTIKNFADVPAKHPPFKKTTFKTYLLDPAGTNIPRNVQITDYEPTRVRTIIQVYDNPITVSTDAPVESPDTSAAGEAPPVGRLLLPNPNLCYEFFGPDALWINSIVNPANVVNPTLSGVVDSATASFAGAAAGNLFGPAAGESIAAWGVYFQAPAAAVQADITLTNVLGGTHHYLVTVPTTGLVFEHILETPIPALNPAAFPNVNVPAIAGGPAYSIWLESLKTITQSRVTVTKEYC